MLCRRKKDDGAKPFKPKPYKRPKIDLKKIDWKDMQKIPESEEDLLKIPIYINMKGCSIVDELIKVTDINEQAYREIFIGDEDSAILSINLLQRNNKWTAGFHFDLLITFWMSVHFGRRKVINHLMKYELYLRQLVTLALFGQPEQPLGYKPQACPNDSPFNRVAGITEETKAKAGLGVKQNESEAGEMKIDENEYPRDKNDSERVIFQEPALQHQTKSMPNLPNISDGRLNQIKDFKENVDQMDLERLKSQHVEQKFGFSEFESNQNNAQSDLKFGQHKRMQPSHALLGDDDQSNDERKDQFEGGEITETLDHPSMPPEEFQEDVDIDQQYSSESSYSDGEDVQDEGDGRGDIPGLKEPNAEMIRRAKEAKLAMIIDMTLISENLSQINHGASDDSQFMFNEEDRQYLLPPTIVMESSTNSLYLRERGITGRDIEDMTLDDEEQMAKLKTKMRIYFPKLMADIVKILLHKKEQKLACLLTAYYELCLDENSFYESVFNMNFEWLNYVWVFGKNFIGNRRAGTSTKVIIKALLEIICRVHQKKNVVVKDCCKQVCEWFMKGDDDEHNMLWGLLSQYQEKLALKYMGYYWRFLDMGLFIYALSNNNTTFMKKALRKQAFEKSMYREDYVVTTMLQFFEEDASKTNFILNVLLLTDISLWRPIYLEQLLEIFENYLEGNQLLLSYNPLMSIALTCDLVNLIGKSRKMFRDRCNDLLEVLLGLGQMYSGKIDDEDYYKGLINDKDFNGRSVLNIICYSQFNQLMSEEDPKAGNLIRNIWFGEDFTACDGNVFGFSNMTYILLTRAQRADESTPYFELVSQGFEKSFKVDYTFQFIYRKMAISEYFFKEFLMGGIMILLYRLVNEDYRTLFMADLKYVGEKVNEKTGDKTAVVIETNGLYDFDQIPVEIQIRDTAARAEMMAQGLEQFSSWYPVIIFLCGSLIYSTVCKILFNTLAKPGKDYRVPYDRWTKIDTLSAVLTLVGFPIILSFPPEEIVKKEVKDMLDYIMLILIFFQWFRFYQFFLMISELSKMILTFVSMIIDTIAFMFLVASYLILSTAIFTTVFQDVNPAVYGTFTLAIRSLFDALMGGWSYKSFGDKEMLHMYMIWLHVFMSNILLLNYLIAILSQSYADMLDKGKFLYKVYLYQYCERYVVGLASQKYGQLVIHPAPICFLNLPIALICWIPGMNDKFLETMSHYFALMMFWLENIFWLGLFLAYEITLIPFVYFKNLVTVAWATQGLFLTIWNTVAWMFSGLIFIAFFIIRDVYYMFRIMTMHDGCRAYSGFDPELQEKEIDPEMEVQCFNEAREIVITKYFEVSKKKVQEGEDEMKIDFDNLKILDMLKEDYEQYEENKEIYVIKASSLVDAWKKEKTVKLKAEEQLKKEANKKEVKETDSARDRREKAEATKKAASSSKLGQLKSANIHKTGGQTEQIVTTYITVVVENEQNEDEAQQDEKEEEPDDALIDLEQDDASEEIVTEFFDKFLINSEGSAASDNVDITWLLQAIPTKILPLNIDQIRKFKFLTLQDAIIARENAEQVTSFEYYDKKNKTRVTAVKDIVIKQMRNLFNIDKNLVTVKEMLQKNEGLLNEYEELIKGWDKERKRITDEEVKREARNQMAPEQDAGEQKESKKGIGKGKGKNKPKK